MSAAAEIAPLLKQVFVDFENGHQVEPAILEAKGDELNCVSIGYKDAVTHPATGQP